LLLPAHTFVLHTGWLSSRPHTSIAVSGGPGENGVLIASSWPSSFIQPHVPEDGGGKRQHAFDVRAIGRGQRPLRPPHVRHLLIGEALDLARHRLLLDRVLGAGPLRAQRFHLCTTRPAEPGLVTVTGHARIDGWTEHVGSEPPGVEQVPASLGWR